VKASAFTARLEEGLLVLGLAVLAFIPLADALGRPLGGIYVKGGAAWVQQLTLWLAFVGGLVATREGKHLTLSTAELFAEGGPVRRVGRILAAALSAGACALLAWSSLALVAANREEGKVLPGGLPEWVSECVIPACLALMALRFALHAGGARRRLAAFLAIPLAFAPALLPGSGPSLLLPLVVLVLLGLVLGAPVFVCMAALALAFFFRDGTPIVAVTAEVYRLISSPTLPAIPLLTACGYVLAESGASHRLLRFFRALLGWMPGGLAVIVTAVCALFTTMTGGSGVTIIAVGGLVYPMLREDGYPPGFSLGLVTAAGSLGLLFPPSLPVILYSVVAGTRDQNVPADALYLAGLLPGLLMILMVAGYAVRVGRRHEVRRQDFSGREVLAATWAAKWELLLPVIVVALFAAGQASMVEAAAAAFAVAVVIECFITRDLSVRVDLPRALVKSSVLTGSVLILLSAAMGITSYIVDAQVPDALVAWVKTHIHSPYVFLLALNALLVVVGCLVDIFSAIVVLAPLIAPMGAAFGIDPVHQGVIFLANLELGFLTPPVGLNLYLSSSRFGRPLTEVTRQTLPFLLLMALAVLVVTYVPSLSLSIPRLLGRY
jgi:tripartite ATP-independent transporter DctM subunit